MPTVKASFYILDFQGEMGKNFYYDDNTQNKVSLISLIAGKLSPILIRVNRFGLGQSSSFFIRPMSTGLFYILYTVFILYGEYSPKSLIFSSKKPRPVSFLCIVRRIPLTQWHHAKNECILISDLRPTEYFFPGVERSFFNNEPVVVAFVSALHRDTCIR